MGFAADRGNRLLFGSLGIEENLFVKKLYKPHLVFPFISLSLSLSLTQTHFFLLLRLLSKILQSHSHTLTPTSILTPLWDPSLEARKLTWVGLHSQSGPHTLGVFLSISGTFSWFGVVFIYVHLLGCVVVTLRCKRGWSKLIFLLTKPDSLDQSQIPFRLMGTMSGERSFGALLLFFWNKI